ncbi:MAG: hypothetical protein PHF00_12090, partial [Elusimicrobia bacterium]|nr:hypothetical protein [Elusimicrobiota bacterium]
MIAIVLSLAAVASPARAGATADCAFGVPPMVIELGEAGGKPGLLQFWDLRTDAMLDLAAPPASATLTEYRKAVSSRLSVAPAD